MTVDKEDRIGVCVISVVEIVYLEEKRRLPAGTFQLVCSLLGDPSSGLIPLPLDVATIIRMAKLPRDQIPDLPDRLIAATAAVLSVPLITCDARIQASGIATIW
jgi:PIN domain nuclease of toxin-antitoxin system